MKKIIIIAVLFFTTLSFSCKKFLDVDQVMNIPSDSAITSVKDLEAVLMGAYDGLQSGDVLGGNMVVYADLLAEDMKVAESRLSNFGTREIYNRATTVQLSPLRNMWAAAYSSINRANTVIYYIDNNLLSGTDFDNVKDRFKGEALFIRAIVHYEIMRFWALPYDVNNPGGNSQPGVPYRSQPTLSGFDDLSMARHSVEDVYSFVINDLAQAKQLLSAAGINKSSSRASKMAATAYLARVYFSKGDYNNASLCAGEVISTGGYSLNANADIQKVFQTSGDVATNESIFQLVNITTDQSNAITYNYKPSDGSQALFSGADTLKKIYSPLDIRRVKYISVNTFSGYISITKYANPPSSNPAYNVSVLRLAEMYLIRAESDLLTGNPSGTPYEDYKAVKSRAFGTNWVEETIDPAAMLDSVRMERRREMIAEGDRYHNLKRMKMNERNNVPWNDPSLLFKIPQEEMSGNPLMVQNP
ncbi:MAG TPA: RagB/SusD family nutrient uptake outer membrane protein [Bacteroidales bacterium]|nr:RagB/SusD family nutrient uptake outer membrane protein [Bacteroidales bacterium]